MTLDEQLSRLLDGDLPPDQAEAIRQRIASEPDVAAAWQEIQDLAQALADLPEEIHPPSLNPQILGVEESATRRWAAWVPWGLAAAAILLVLLRPVETAPTVLLASGESYVEGQLSLMAGDQEISLDGRARIFVEPPPTPTRVPGQTHLEDTMKLRLASAALVGSVVTIAVLEGTATIKDAGGAPIVLEAGAEHTLGAAPARPAPPQTPRSSQSQLQTRLAELEAELDQTRSALAAEKLSGAFMRGQLEVMEGTPSEWPTAGVPGPMTPDNFEAELKAVVAGVEDAEVEWVDCGEYPCVAAIRYRGDDEQWTEGLQEDVGTWVEDQLGEDRNMSVNTSVFRQNDLEARYVIFGAHNADQAVTDRTSFRIDDMVEVLGDEVAAEAEALRGAQ